MRRPKPPNTVTISIFTTITIIFWVFLNVYRILTEEPPPQVSAEILESINPDLDVESLRSLPNRLYFVNEKIVEFKANSTNTINEDPPLGESSDSLLEIENNPLNEEDPTTNNTSIEIGSNPQ